jgi:serine/threonine protein kinase
MSPEQARGAAADKRCDVWSFGVVLYEMLTGAQAFGRETVTDTLAAVVQKDPDWNLLPAATPPSIRRLLRRCLERDRKKRLPEIGAARLEIEDALSRREYSGHSGEHHELSSADRFNLPSFDSECDAQRALHGSRLTVSGSELPKLTVELAGRPGRSE